MAKGKSSGLPVGLNAGAMQQLAAKMKEEMMRAQEELSEQRLTVSAGGEAVSVVIDGNLRLHHLKISPEAIAQGDIEMLQDLLVVAVNSAIEQAQTLAAERLQGVGGGLLPGM